jgi:S-adenosylmethionine hydrolase
LRRGRDAIITLTTDFGTSDAYVAAMKGVILSINPRANIVDVTHDVEPQNIPQAAFVLHTAHGFFPQGTIHLAVVDPGVGSQRRAVILRTTAAYFVAPDNGVLSYVVEEACPTASPQPEDRELGPGLGLGLGLEAVVITAPRFWRPSVSPTFHGRDIFAPVAAHLSLGVPIGEFGEAISSLFVLPASKPRLQPDGVLLGDIIHIDRFGNLITNVRGADLPGEGVTIEVAAHSIQSLSRFYEQGDELLAIIGSSGYLEVSLKNGSAAAFLHSKSGDKLKIKPH